MMGVRIWAVCLTGVFLGVFLPQAGAVPIYSTSFESSEGYVLGDLDGQDGRGLCGTVQSPRSSAGLWGMEIASWSGSGRSPYHSTTRAFSAPTESLPPGNLPALGGDGAGIAGNDQTFLRGWGHMRPGPHPCSHLAGVHNLDRVSVDHAPPGARYCETQLWRISE